ncbi:ABC transporter G family member 37-like [Panicum miliaceum]|uniref:ABC transporter G family member 37-like n=1 Tax=Panicum miliaceum TaxID=4540 RepID=A0A3L6R6L4_PANMI|nr:ABC transporter G family member 37-like [Panicum miliaceum]
MELPTIDLRAEDLAVQAEAYAGGRAAPNIFNSMTNTILDAADTLQFLPSNWKTKYTIVHKTSAVFRPRRMTLLLGSPGSGKTTLLKALAGKLDSGVKVSGKITYNWREMNEIVPEKIAAYVSQSDLHSGEMTVRETLAFSAKCQGVGDGYDLLTELMRREREANVTPDDDIALFMKVKLPYQCPTIIAFV